ncbi:hypothetical protein [Haladaptatus caseinilyticus]|uniref:hypothetical protein n=1 Tax=Haladaptatus caseinilyticus TaxID=2993314 RepID=UPI00224B4A15|nr:hypothetical protein [Haladaptatus caseinilyticus]
MGPNETSPLTPLAQDALDALAKRLPDEEEFTYEHAYTILKEEEDLERPTAEDIIERLYNKAIFTKSRENSDLLITDQNSKDHRLYFSDVKTAESVSFASFDC